MSEQRRMLLQVSGKVQAVGYRHAAGKAAERIGIALTADNQDDGTVLIDATGTPDQLEELRSWAEKGSPVAEVESVQVLKVENVGSRTFG